MHGRAVPVVMLWLAPVHIDHGIFFRRAGVAAQFVALGLIATIIVDQILALAAVVIDQISALVMIVIRDEAAIRLGPRLRWAPRLRRAVRLGRAKVAIAVVHVHLKILCSFS
jgi:hypothetical protein